MLQIGQNIEWIRLSKGMNREEFSEIFEKYGLNPDKLYSYEKNRAKPNNVLIAKIAEYANIAPDDLLNKNLNESSMYQNSTIKLRQSQTGNDANDDKERLIAELKERVKFLEDQVKRLNELLLKQLEKS